MSNKHIKATQHHQSWVKHKPEPHQGTTSTHSMPLQNDQAKCGRRQRNCRLTHCWLLKSWPPSSESKWALTTRPCHSTRSFQKWAHPPHVIRNKCSQKHDVEQPRVEEAPQMVVHPCKRTLLTCHSTTTERPCKWHEWISEHHASQKKPSTRVCSTQLHLSKHWKTYNSSAGRGSTAATAWPFIGQSGCLQSWGWGWRSLIPRGFGLYRCMQPSSFCSMKSVS